MSIEDDYRTLEQVLQKKGYSVDIAGSFKESGGRAGQSLFASPPFDKYECIFLVTLLNEQPNLGEIAHDNTLKKKGLLNYDSFYVYRNKEGVLVGFEVSSIPVIELPINDLFPILNEYKVHNINKLAMFQEDIKRKSYKVNSTIGYFKWICWSLSLIFCGLLIADIFNYIELNTIRLILISIIGGLVILPFISRIKFGKFEIERSTYMLEKEKMKEEKSEEK